MIDHPQSNTKMNPVVADSPVRLAGQLLLILDWLSDNAWRWVLGPTVWLMFSGSIQAVGQALNWSSWTLWIGHGLAFLVGLAVLLWAVRVQLLGVDDEAATNEPNPAPERPIGGHQ